MTDEDKELEQLRAEFRKEAEANIDKVFPGLPNRAVSTPVTMDPRPAPMMRPPEDRASKTSPLPREPGAVETFMGQLHDTNDPKDMEGLANTKAFMGFVGGASGGAIAGKAFSALPAARALLGAKTLAPRLVGAGLEGGVSGVGATAGSALAQGRLPEAKEMVAGGAMGAAMGVGGKLLGEAVTGAPARAGTAMLSAVKAGGMTTPEYGRFFASREGAQRTIGADKDLFAAIRKQDPDEVLAVLAQRQPEANALGRQVMDAIDAKNGRIPVVDVNKAIGSVFHALEKTGGEASTNPAAAAAYKMLQQFSTGIGKDLRHPPSTAEVRRFLTEEVGAKLNTNPNVEDSATDRAAAMVYGKLKDLIGQHAQKAGPQFAKQIETLNEQQSTYALLENAWTRLQAKASTGAPTKTESWMNPIAGTARAMGGAVAGRTVAHFAGIDPQVPEAIGATAGALAPAVKAVASTAGDAATRALANSPTAQKIGPALEPIAKTAAHVLVPKILDAVRNRDAQKGTPADAAAVKAMQAHVADAVYGER